MQAEQKQYPRVEVIRPRYPRETPPGDYKTKFPESTCFKILNASSEIRFASNAQSHSFPQAPTSPRNGHSKLLFCSGELGEGTYLIRGGGRNLRKHVIPRLAVGAPCPGSPQYYRGLAEPGRCP